MRSLTALSAFLDVSSLNLAALRKRRHFFVSLESVPTSAEALHPSSFSRGRQVQPWPLCFIGEGSQPLILCNPSICRSHSAEPEDSLAGAIVGDDRNIKPGAVLIGVNNLVCHAAQYGDDRVRSATHRASTIPWLPREIALTV